MDSPVELTFPAAYRAIESESTYQKETWPRHQSLTVGEEIVLVQRYAHQLVEAWATHPGDTAALEVMRKIATICCRTMENHEAPLRVVETMSNAHLQHQTGMEVEIPAILHRNDNENEEKEN